MSIRVMIIDGQAEFRSLLMHHVTTCWHDAIISAYDPTAAGHLPEEFSGAGNDLVLLGSAQGDRDPLKTLRQFRRVAGFPPVLYFGAGSDEERQVADRLGVEALFDRDHISHDALTVRMSDVLRSRRRVSSTGNLFVGDLRRGSRPLIKGYRLVRRLSTSDYSSVYLAERESASLNVVLKVLRQVPDLADGLGAFDRFLQEYELIAGLEHPGIVRIYDLGVGDDHAHIAMEYMPAGDLKQKIAAGINERHAVSYVKQLAGAIAEMHGVGILHRDLKPGNIMFRDDGSLSIIDFGLAKQLRLDAEMTGSGEIFGTPYYMSPEQGHAEEVDQRSDVYSLGVIFYEMLTGRKPYRASSAMGIIYKHSHAPIPLLPHYLSQYQAIINLMLAKDPENRLQSVGELDEWL
ncbi:MAG: serine/threonine-protein kinase [Pseudomonadota bacterium]